MSGHIEWRDTVRQDDGTLKAVKGKDGRWRARWKYRHGDRWLSKTFACEKKADAIARATKWGADEAERHRKRRWQDPRAELTFAEVAEQWRGTWGGLGPRTKNGYDHLLRLHVLPAFGSSKIGDVTVAGIERWLNELATTRSRATLDRIFGVVRGVMKLAKRHGYIDENPCADVQLPRRANSGTSGRHRQLFLTANEVNAIANEIDPHWRTAVYVAAWCGLRAGELWGLRYCDVDLNAGTLTIAQALKETNGVPADATWLSDDERGLYLGPPKTEASRRTLTMPAPITQMLATHLPPRPGGADPDALVFTAPAGGPVRHSLFYARAWQPAVRRVFPVGHPKRALRWHDLRHTCASLSLAVAGGDLHVVKERLGHESIKTTVDCYGHLLQDAEAKLALGLAAMFNAAVEPSNVIPIRREAS